LNVIISKLLEQIECCSEFPSSEIIGADWTPYYLVNINVQSIIIYEIYVC
jgi:hypothetical protein